MYKLLLVRAQPIIHWDYVSRQEQLGLCSDLWIDVSDRWCSGCGSQPVATCVVPQLNDLIRMGSYTNYNFDLHAR